MILVDDNQYQPSYRATQGTVPMSVGDESKLIIDVYTPNGVNEVSTEVVSGSVLALSILNGYSSISPLSRGAGGVSSYTPLTRGAEGVSSPNPIFTQGMNLLYNSASDQVSNWNSAESEIAGFSGVRVVHPEVSIVAAKPVVNISTTLWIVTGMQTTGAAIDALSRISSAIPITSDTGVSTKGFMYLSGYEGSYLEEKAFEDVLGVESISTMKLLRIAAGQGISIVTINQQNIGTVLNSLASEERDGVRSIPGLDPTTSTAIISNIQNLVNQGLEIQIPISGTTYQSFTGTGYIALNLTTGEGGYYLSGNLHGGMTVLALSYWPPIIGIPILYPYEPVGPPDTNPDSVSQLVLVSQNWAVGTVGQFLEAPLIVRAVDSAGVPVSGATISFYVGDGGGCIAPYDMSVLPLPPQLPVPVCTDGTVSVMTGYTGEAGAWFELGKYTKDNPIYYKESLLAPSVTQALVNTLNVVSQNSIGLQGGYTAIGIPDKPVALIKIMDASSAVLGSYSGFIAAMVQDQYNNPVSNIPISFNVQNMNYVQGNIPDGALNMYLVSENHIGMNGCPPLPTLNDRTTCFASGSITEMSDFKGASVGVIMGNLADTIYSLTASEEGLDTLTFTYDFTGSYSPSPNTYNDAIIPYVALSSDYAGHILNAGSPKGSGSFNVYVYEEHNTCTWIGPKCEISCTDVWSMPAPAAATLNITTQQGTGTAATPIQDAIGVYTVPITLGGKPEYEQYQVNGQVTVPKIEIKNLPTSCTINPNLVVFGAPIAPYYAVAINPVTASPDPLILNRYFYSTADLNITYTILPPEYTANTAQVDILSAAPNTTSWMPKVSPIGNTSGTDTVTMNKGSLLDPTKSYEAQVVLNRGISGDEIDSNAVSFNVVKFLIQQPIPDIFSFISTDVITTSASTGWPFIDSSINWAVISNPANPVDSGSVTYKPSPPMGATIQFTPNPPPAVDGRNGKLSYTINAGMGNNVLDSITITQDERDELRQEYVDVTINGVSTKPIPARNQFCQATNPACSSAHFSYEELTVNDYYPWAIITPALLNGLEIVRASYGLPMLITSGYRTPANNKRVGGVVDSQHIYGMAADIAATCPEWDDLAAIALQKGAWVEGYCDGKTHVHMDWGPNAPGGPKTNCESTCP